MCYLVEEGTFSPGSLAGVILIDTQRNLHPSPLATTAELLERIKANMRIARK